MTKYVRIEEQRNRDQRPVEKRRNFIEGTDNPKKTFAIALPVSQSTLDKQSSSDC